MLSYDTIENRLDNKVKKILEKLHSNYLFYLVIFGFLYQIIALYPGFIYADGWAQYAQGKGIYPLGDWHPPLLSWVWYLQLHIYDSEKIFYAINIFIFWTALYIIFSYFSKGALSGIIAFITGNLPFFIVENGVVIKDIHFGIVILLIFSLLLSDKKNFFSYFTIILLLVYCTFIRVNAVFLTAPFFVFIIFHWKGLYLKYIYSLFTVLIVVVITPFVNHTLLRAHDDKSLISLAIFDFAGISYRTGMQLFPVDIPEDIAVHIHKDCYTPNWWDNYAGWSSHAQCKLYAGKVFAEPTKFVIRKWFEAIKDHPLAYIRHRLSAFDRFLNYTGHRTNAIVFYGSKPGFGPNEGQEGSKSYDRPIYHFATKLVDTDNIWFANYFWFSILIGIFIVSFNGSTRLERLINAVSFAGSMYLFGFLFVGVAYGFRYAFPTVTLGTGLIITMFIHRRLYGVYVGSVKKRIGASLFVFISLLLGCAL